MERRLAATEVNNMDVTVKDLVDKLKGPIETKLGRTFTTFIPLLYKQEFSQGINYWGKILAENENDSRLVNECLHVKMYLTTAASEPQLKDQSAGKSVLDEIVTA